MSDYIICTWKAKLFLLCRRMKVSILKKCKKKKKLKIKITTLRNNCLFIIFPEHFRSISLFIGGNVRKAVNEGRADCIPIFLHEIPRIFNEGVVKPDMALIHVSPPDEQGYCSLGTSVDSVRSAVVNAKVVVGKKKGQKGKNIFNKLKVFN